MTVNYSIILEIIKQKIFDRIYVCLLNINNFSFIHQTRQ